MPIPQVRETLLAYSRKQATTEQVMRAVVAHDDWMLPVFVANKVLGRTSGEIVLLGERFSHPLGTLLLYSDVEAARRAHESGTLALGPFVRGIAGVEIFAKLRPGFHQVIVNEGCPTEEKLYLAGPNFGGADVWADAIRLERAFDDEQTPPLELAERICAYDAFFVALHAETGAIVTLQFPGFGNAGVLFTAPDCLAVFLARHPEVPVTTGQTTGARVTSQMASLGVDGFVINPYGPGEIQVISLDELEIAMLAAS